MRSVSVKLRISWGTYELRMRPNSGSSPVCPDFKKSIRISSGFRNAKTWINFMESELTISSRRRDIFPSIGSCRPPSSPSSRTSPCPSVSCTSSPAPSSAPPTAPTRTVPTPGPCTVREEAARHRVRRIRGTLEQIRGRPDEQTRDLDRESPPEEPVEDLLETSPRLSYDGRCQDGTDKRRARLGGG